MAISPNKNNREFDSYIEDPIDGGTNRRVESMDADSRRVVIIDRVNSNLSYEGRAAHNSLTSSAVWQIKRILTTAGVTTTIYADSGNYNQIWDNRATIFTPGSVLNQYSIEFDGVNDYIDFGDIHNYQQATQFSYSFWIKADNFAATRFLISTMDATAPVTGWRIGIDTAGKITTQSRTSGSSLGFVTFNTVLTAATWYHIAWTWSGGSNQNSQKLYVNGVLDSLVVPSAALTGTGFATAVSLEVGRSLSAFYFSGNMDELSIYNKNLSLAEVQEIYNLGNPLDLNALTTSGNLVSWWRMGDGDTFPMLLDQKGIGNGTMTNMVIGNIDADVP